MLYSMQTHFDVAPSIGSELCAALKNQGVQHFRLSGMDSRAEDIEKCLTMIFEADTAGVDSLLTIRDLELLKQISSRDIEWDNEPDGDVLPKDFHKTFMEAYEICLTNRNRLHGPAISNLDEDSLAWLREFMSFGVPSDVIITYHHYTPGMFFKGAHKGFRSRDAEMKELLKIVGEREIACSESGYDDADAVRQENNVKKEIDFAHKYKLKFWTYYQINDDPKIPNNYGARYLDGTWKSVMSAYHVNAYS